MSVIRPAGFEPACIKHRFLVCCVFLFHQGRIRLIQDIRFELIRVAPQSLSLLRLPFSPILQMHHEGFEPFTFCGLKPHASTNWANGAYQVFSCSLLSRSNILFISFLVFLKASYRARTGPILPWQGSAIAS